MYIEQVFKGNNEWWRVFITTILTAGIFIGNIIAYLMMSKEEMDAVFQMMKTIPNNWSLIINLLPFILLLGLLFLLVRKLHNRSVLSLSTSRSKVAIRKILFSLFLVILMNIIVFSLSYYWDNTAINWNFKPKEFAILFIISILLFPFQIGFEEYLFRGYFMQQLGFFAKNKWFPLAVTSVLFGLLHSANPEVAKMGYGVMVFYIGTGFFLGIMTLMDEGIELALGFHLGNNLMAALLITSDYAALQTDAIFKYSGVEKPIDMLFEMIVSIAIVYPIILIIFAKRYKWINWLEKLTGTVKNPYANQK